MLKKRCARWGWSSVLAWAIFGLGLEALHALKASIYLDDELTRLLLTLAHAHGIGLSLVVIVFGGSGVACFGHNESGAQRAARQLFAASALIPIGFVAGAIGHPEGDPSLGVLLTPIGALCLIAGLFHTAKAAWDAASNDAVS